MENKKVKCPATGKTRFATPGHAKAAIQKIKFTSSHRRVNYVAQKRINRNAGKPDQCRYYYCNHCCGYHLTSSVKKSYKKFIKDTSSKNYQNLVITPEKAEEWKKDSLPFPTDKLNNMSNNLTFIDAQQMALDHPHTFEAPSSADLAQLEVGDYVKVCPGEERFWCQVVSIDFVNAKVKATVANNLIMYDFEVGQELNFEMKHIYEIIKYLDL